ncbi:hypothetical protein [Pengzhenrongella sicca]|uniref:Lipoprotein n=1 Tax=Pengzhenrongella sicca TaxID=2819238 RepID=A0A8A4ZCN8_9MICO|nr:hypothetical protein [Pengzhenrongella sicca]QTE29135.1 hypothetical protein J4E96_17860 [Pengzhenrongella sicca]
MIRSVIATAALATLLLAGCTGQDPPAPPPDFQSAEPTPTTTPTPTPSPTPEFPEPPADLVRTDEVGAAAAAGYFVALYPLVLSTGNVDAWDAISGDPCEFCESIRRDALSMAQKGESYSGGVIGLSDVEVLGRDDLIGGYPVDAKFVQSPSLYQAADGSIITQTDGDSGIVRIDTLNTSAGWKILAVVVRDAP